MTVEIRQGSADIEQVMKDMVSLTKLNFNGAEYGDGLPVTLRFADLVGEMLTAGPITPHAPRKLVRFASESFGYFRL